MSKRKAYRGLLLAIMLVLYGCSDLGVIPAEEVSDKNDSSWRIIREPETK